MGKCTRQQVQRLKTALRWKIPRVQRQRIQMVLLRESGMTQPLIAAAMGVSLSTVNRAHMAYDHGGVKALKPKPSGGRQRQNMTLEEEKALLARFANAAGAGEMLNIHDLKAAYEKAIGHETSKSTIYNLLGRHGWRKLMPRPFHPKRDIAAQDAFKKAAFQTPRGKPSGLLPGEAAVCGLCSRMKRVSAGSTGHGPAGLLSVSDPRSPPSSFANTSICTARSPQKTELAFI
jgi:transposase